jgi:hypothetical protein
MYALDKAKVLSVARDAAAKRGYVTYSDFNDYLRELIIKKKLQPIEGGRVQWTIKKMLEDQNNPIENRFVHSRTGTRTLFYPAVLMDNNPFLKPASKQAELK